MAAAGFRTLVLTVDTPVSANRENNVRTGFSTPLRPTPRLFWDGVTRPRWLFGTFLRTLLRHGMPHFENNYATRGAPIVSRNVARDFSDRGHLNWAHFRFIRGIWPGRLVIKGILSAADARIARDAGADGIIVSNHGGRQLDGAISSFEALPAIVRAVRTTHPDLPILLDGGIRRGADLAKALALGATAGLIARPQLWGLAVAGEAGVAHVLEIYRRELDRAMGLLGAATLRDLQPRLLAGGGA